MSAAINVEKEPSGDSAIALNPSVRTLEYWKDRWEKKDITFHKVEVHPMLVKHIESLVAGRSNVKIFIPLCGKALDMKWFYDQGHDVVGVEVSHKACEEFFQDHSLEYTVEPITQVKGTLLKSADGRIKLYCCSIFEFSRETEGEFGAVWDRGSLVAVNPEERKKYSVLLQSLMSADCRYLLETFDYDPTLYSGPPNCITEEEIHELYGFQCDIEVLDTHDVLSENNRKVGMTYFNGKVRKLTRKTNN